MERTQALVVNPRLAQVNEFAHHIHNVDGIHYLVNCRSVYHACKDNANRAKCKINVAQNARFVHKRVVFVHFIWLCAQKVVPLQPIFEKRISFLHIIIIIWH